MQGAEPAAGVLYLVGTPIGNTGDLSPRAKTVLAGADRIACEDTRRSGLLLHNLGIKNRLVSFHEHNQATRIPELLEALENGEAIAVISDAGLPGISDPGEELVSAARGQGRTVICVPGPCAATTALVSSGLPCGRFCFEGFLPPKATARRARLQALAPFIDAQGLGEAIGGLLAAAIGQQNVGRTPAEPAQVRQELLLLDARGEAGGGGHHGRAKEHCDAGR